MSAFVVNKSHINAMVQAASHARLGWYHDKQFRQVNSDNIDAVGQMLLDENVKSVGYRYEDSQLTNLPGMADAEYLIPFQSHFVYKRLKPVELIKIITCYEYQSCEHPEWHTSEAKVFCESLKSDAISNLPGYDEAPWEWTDEQYYKAENIQRII